MALDGLEPERLVTLLESAVSKRAWLVLVAHEVGVAAPAGTPGGDLAVTGEALEALCGRLATDPRVWPACVRDVAGFIASDRHGAGETFVTH
mgnify:CR=1 FL=1